jgi:uncharacterized protein (DUF849 family)
MTMAEKLVINLAPTGMIPTKKMTEFVPVSVNEVVEDVHQAWEIGISMVHLHARDPNTGVPTYKSKIYGEMIEGIRKFSKELVICVSLSGRDFGEFEKRSEPLQLDGDLKPDMGSLTLSSLNRGAFLFQPAAGKHRLRTGRHPACRNNDKGSA